MWKIRQRGWPGKWEEVRVVGFQTIIMSFSSSPSGSRWYRTFTWGCTNIIEEISCFAPNGILVGSTVTGIFNTIDKVWRNNQTLQVVFFCIKRVEYFRLAEHLGEVETASLGTRSTAGGHAHCEHRIGKLVALVINTNNKLYILNSC